MNFLIQDVHPFHLLLISLILGLLVGLQRQWADAPLAGFRTFGLVSLLGTVCAFISDKFSHWIVIAGLLGVCTAIVSGHIGKKRDSTTSEHSGLVTEFALLLMYSAGVLVGIGSIWLAAALTGALAVVLQAKIELHWFAKRFSDREIKAIMQFVLISLVIFPLVPNRTFGLLDVLNLHDIWLMVMIIVGISLAGYISYKFFGERAGVGLSGILGGVISSTATTLSCSKFSNESPRSIPYNALIVLIAWTTTYLRLLLEVVAVAPSFQTIWLPLGGMFLVSLLAVVWMWKGVGGSHTGMLAQKNPTEIGTALTFGILYSVIILAVAFAKDFLGTSGLTFVALISGITDMDAITLSTSRLVESGKLPQGEAWRIIIVACMSNVAFKGALARVFGGKKFFAAIAIPMAVTLLVAIGILMMSF